MHKNMQASPEAMVMSATPDPTGLQQAVKPCLNDAQSSQHTFVLRVWRQGEDKKRSMEALR